MPPNPNREPEHTEFAHRSEREVFAANLIRIRQARGYTQDDLAAASGVNQSHISRLENAAWDARISTVLALARALRVPATDLLPALGEVPQE